MLVWAHEEWVCIFAHRPFSKYHDVSTMSSCGPIIFRVRGRALVEENARIGPRCEHTALADELELAQSNLKTFTCNHSHGPAMRTHCPCRRARVGPKQPENIHLQPLAWARDAN